MFCKKCGTAIIDGNNFCLCCGRKIYAVNNKKSPVLITSIIGGVVIILFLGILLLSKVVEISVYNDRKNNTKTVQNEENAKEFPVEGIRLLNAEEKQALSQSSENYQKINWIAEYMLDDNPIVISIAPLNGEREGVYVLGFTNIGDETCSIYGMIGIADEKGKHMESYKVYTDNLGYGCTYLCLMNDIKNSQKFGIVDRVDFDIRQSSVKNGEYTCDYKILNSKLQNGITAIVTINNNSQDKETLNNITCCVLDKQGNIKGMGSSTASNKIYPGISQIGMVDIYGIEDYSEENDDVAIFTNICCAYEYTTDERKGREWVKNMPLVDLTSEKRAEVNKTYQNYDSIAWEEEYEVGEDTGIILSVAPIQDYGNNSLLLCMTNIEDCRYDIYLDYSFLDENNQVVMSGSLLEYGFEKGNCYFHDATFDSFRFSSGKLRIDAARISKSIKGSEENGLISYDYSMKDGKDEHTKNFELNCVNNSSEDIEVDRLYYLAIDSDGVVSLFHTEYLSETLVIPANSTNSKDFEIHRYSNSVNDDDERILFIKTRKPYN